MANNDINSPGHALELIRAALPYVNSRMKNSMEVAIKTGELAETFSNATNPDELSACDLGNEGPFDLEGMLTSIGRVALGPEQEMINTVLNFYKTRNLYRSYQEFKRNNTPQPQPQQSSQNVRSFHQRGNQFYQQPDLQAASVNNTANNTGNNNMGHSMFQNNTLMQFLMSQLSPDQKATFDSMSMLMNSGNFNMNMMNNMMNMMNNNTSSNSDVSAASTDTDTEPET